MKIKIKVTKDVLRKAMWCGTEKSESKCISTNCAVALAVRDIFPHAQVSNKITTWVKVDRELSDVVKLPIEAVEFINKFDSLVYDPESRLNLTEFEFEVHVPEHIISAINISAIHKSETLEVVA